MFRFHGRVKNSVGLAVRAAFFNGRGGQYNSPNTTGGFFESAYFYAVRTSSITQTRGAGTPTETRATVATVMGYAADATLADGQTLLTVASGELRFQGARRVSEGVWSNVDADGAPIPAATLDGSVVEAAATNLIWPSNDLTNAQWTARGTASAVKNATGPDGVTNSATTIVINTSAGPNDIYYTTALSGLGAGTRGEPHLWINKTTASGIVTFQNASGAGVGVWTINLANVPSGWNRITRDHAAVTIGSEFASTAGGAVQLQFFCNTGGPVTLAVYGVNYVTGATYSSETIVTTTAAATRNKDVLDDQVSSNLTATAGTVAFTWTPSHDPSGTIALCGSYVDASNYTALLHDGTKYIWRKRIAGVNYDAELTAAYANGTSAKIALTLGASGINLAVDGTLGTAHANTDDAQLGTRWQWGADGNGGQQAGAAFKEKYLTPRTMSDAELQAITV